MLLSLDLFGAPAPTFNISGEGEVRTFCGGIVSSVIITVTMLFSLLKLQHLMSKHNPSINVFEDINAWGTGDVMVPEESDDFMVAFAVTSIGDPVRVKNDPSFVKWVAFQRNVVDGQETAYEVPVHKCTDEEYARFHEPEDEDTLR